MKFKFRLLLFNSSFPLYLIQQFRRTYMLTLQFITLSAFLCIKKKNKCKLLKIKGLPSSDINTIVRFRGIALLRWKYGLPLDQYVESIAFHNNFVALRSVFTIFTFVPHVLLHQLLKIYIILSSFIASIARRKRGDIDIFALLFKTGYIVPTASHFTLLTSMCRQCQVGR